MEGVQIRIDAMYWILMGTQVETSDLFVHVYLCVQEVDGVVGLTKQPDLRDT